jgi:hypothetical protein
MPGRAQAAEHLSQPDDLDGREILGHALAGEGDVERPGDLRELASCSVARRRGRARSDAALRRPRGAGARRPDATLDSTDVPVLELSEAPADTSVDPVSLDAPERT